MSAAPKNICLSVEDVDLSWDGALVCEDISFMVAEGEIVCLLGRSGSGKSTLLHAIAGLARPDAGRILLRGEDITGSPGKVSYMLQKDLLLPEHNIVDNVAMPLVVGGMPKREARNAASSRFREFGIEGTERLYPPQLSGGMRQRAALLRTYLTRNDVVLMDEPFSALDAFTRSDMQSWFLGMITTLGLSCIIVTHDIDEAVAMADRILVLATGGDPAGQASTIVSEIPVDAPRSERAEFILTQRSMDIKKAVLSSI